jgi:hypothetical protein
MLNSRYPPKYIQRAPLIIGDIMGDAPHWRIYYIENKGLSKDERENHHQLDDYLGCMFDNWNKWLVPESGQFKEVLSQRIDLGKMGKPLVEGDVVKAVPAKDFKPDVARFSTNKPDFNWVLANVKDQKLFTLSEKPDMEEITASLREIRLISTSEVARTVKHHPSDLGKWTINTSKKQEIILRIVGKTIHVFLEVEKGENQKNDLAAKTNTNAAIDVYTKNKKNVAHAFLNKGADGRPQFRVYVEAMILPGEEAYQNPRKDSEDMILKPK